MEIEKSFHLGDILSITTELMLSPTNMKGIGELLSYMVQADIRGLLCGLITASKVCKPKVLEQHPILNSVQIQAAVADLEERLKENKNASLVVNEWLTKLISGGYGIKLDEFLPIKPIYNDRRKWRKASRD